MIFLLNRMLSERLRDRWKKTAALVVVGPMVVEAMFNTGMLWVSAIFINQKQGFRGQKSGIGGQESGGLDNKIQATL
jgi:hypothetical protein